MRMQVRCKASRKSEAIKDSNVRKWVGCLRKRLPVYLFDGGSVGWCVVSAPSTEVSTWSTKVSAERAFQQPSPAVREHFVRNP